MWVFFKAGSDTCEHSLSLSQSAWITKLCAIKRQQRVGLSYEFWFGGLLVPVTVQSFPSHSFSLEMVVLKKCFFHFWERVVKKGCAANVSEMEMCQFIHKVGCVVSYTLRVCGIQIHVLDMLQWGFLHTFLHALCSACGYTLHLHMGVLTLLRIKWIQRNKIIDEGFAVWCR